MLAPMPVREPAHPRAPEAEAEPGSARRGGRFRFDGLFWRRLGYLGATRGPYFWQRIGPAIVAGVVFLIAHQNRRGAVANLRAILGSQGWLVDHLRALRLFHRFAYCTTDVWRFEAAGRDGAFENQIEVQTPPNLDLERVVEEGRGLIVITSHFGAWEVGARALHRFARPVHLVMAREANPTVEEFQRSWRERFGLKVIYSDTSPFASLNMIQALRRGEIVAIQLDRAAGGQVTRDIEFFGRPAPFQYGPFALARLAGVPLWPVFVARCGPGRYRLLPEPLRTIPRSATEVETMAVMTDVVRSFERHVRDDPYQWFQFRPVWRQ